MLLQQVALANYDTISDRKIINGNTHLCFFTAENFSETMCFKKLKQKKKIWGRGTFLVSSQT